MVLAFQTCSSLGSSLFRDSTIPSCKNQPFPLPKIYPRIKCQIQQASPTALRTLGSSDLKVTEVCLGTMTWGRGNSAAEAEQQMDYAFKECGINFLDTAEVYPVPVGLVAPGITERIIGDYLSKNSRSFREHLIIATKVCGYIPKSLIPATRQSDDIDIKNPPPLAHNSLSPADIFAACDASLRRLRTDYIDLYQFHWPDRYVPSFGSRVYDLSKEHPQDAPITPVRESLNAIKELLDAGKIRAYGLSNETTYGVAEIVHAADKLNMPRPCTIQNQFCLLNRSFEAELAEACAPSHYNISLLPYSILGGGSLSGKYSGKMNSDGTSSDPSLQNSRLVKFPQFMSRYLSDSSQNATEQYAKIAKDAGMSLATLSQAFCKSRFFIDSSIIGATKLEQLKENIDAFNVTLDDEVLKKIDEVHFANKDISIIS